MYIVHISSVLLACIQQGFVDPKCNMVSEVGWCQNRGCICISSVRRTYGRIHIPATIILWSELFPKKRREKIQGEILQSIFEYSGVSTNNTHFYKNYKISSNTVYSTVFPHAIQQLQVILHTELILLQEFSKKYYNYKAHPVSSRAYKASSSNCSPCIQAILHGRIQP